MKRLLISTAVAAVLSATPAIADQITIGANTAGTIMATGLGAGSIKLTLFAGIAGPAYFGSEVGTYALGPVTIQGGPITAGIFSLGANPSETFAFDGADGDRLAGAIVWDDGEIKDDSPNPDLIADALDITSASGDAEFLASFQPGGRTGFDLTFATVDTEFGQLAACDGEPPCLSEFVGLSSGEIPGNTIPVSEPGTLGLLGSALLALGLLWRRRAPASCVGL